MKMIRLTTDRDTPVVINAEKIIFFGPGKSENTTTILLDGDCEITARMSFGQLQALLQETPTYGVWADGRPKRSLGSDGQLPYSGTVANNEHTFGLQHG